MSRPLVFMMGQSPAFLPIDRQYARNHMWATAIEGGYRFGFSAYAVRLLGQMRHLEWSAQPRSPLDQGQPIGTIEASKATSDLYAPISGVLGRLNMDVVADPTLINSDLYEAAWLFTMTCREQAFLSPQQYLNHLEASWPLAQRLLKGQAGKQ